MVEASDVSDKDLRKGILISDILDFSEISAQKIRFTGDRDDGIEVNANMFAVHGLSDVIREDTDNNVLETLGMNDSLVDTRDISDTAQEVGSDVIERIHAMKLLGSQNKSCLLESHL